MPKYHVLGSFSNIVILSNFVHTIQVRAYTISILFLIFSCRKMEQQRSRMHSAHFFHVDLDNNDEEEEDGSGTSASNEEDNTETECSDEELTSLHLTLENFDNDQIPDDCPFVLTSPRSLEACKLVGVRVS